MILFITSIIINANNSYNIYIEKELSKQTEFYNKYELNKLQFNNDFHTIINNDSLKKFNFNELIILSQVDSLTGLNDIIEKANQINYVDERKFEITINSLENQIINLEHNKIIILSEESEFFNNKLNDIFTNVSIEKEQIKIELENCQTCYEIKDSYQWLEIDFNNIDEKYVIAYLDKLKDFKRSAKSDISCKRNNLKECTLQKLIINFEEKTKNNLIDHLKNGKKKIPEYTKFNKEINKINKIIDELEQNKNIIKQILDKINDKQVFDDNLLNKLKSISKKKVNNSNLIEIKNQAKEYIQLLETPLNIELKQNKQLDFNFESNIQRIMDQLKRNNELRLNQISFLNIILNSFYFYESENELEKIYYELINEILLKYTKKNENKKSIKKNVINDIQILKYNYVSIKKTLNDEKKPNYYDKKTIKKIIESYNNLLKEMLTKIDEDKNYDLTYYNTEDNEKQFIIKTNKIKDIIDQISSALNKLKANENLIFEQKEDYYTVGIEDNFYKKVLNWLGIYIQKNNIDRLKKSNEKYLLINSEDKFSKQQLLNINQSEIIEISKDKISLINKLQREINEFDIKYEYKQDEIEELLNLIDYYFFINYLIENDINSFLTKINIDFKFNEYLNNIAYNKLSKFKSENKQNFVKNTYNSLIANRLNLNSHFIKEIQKEFNQKETIEIINEFTNESNILNINIFEKAKWDITPINNNNISKNKVLLDKKNFEILKYAIMSINKEFEQTKLNKEIKEPYNFKIENINNNDKYSKLTYHNNLDFHNRLSENKNNLTYADIVIFLKDRINIAIINKILQSNINKINNTQTYNDIISEISELKYAELSLLINSEFDSYSNDPFNNNYLNLVNKKGVDPLINYLNSLIQKEYFYKYSREHGLTQLYSIKKTNKVNDNNIELLQKLFNNRKNGYIISQNEEEIILKKALNETINKIINKNIFTSHSNYNETYKIRRQEFLDLLDVHFKLKLILEAIEFHGFEINILYDEINTENEKIIKQYLTKDNYNLAIEYNIIKSNIISKYKLIKSEQKENEDILYLEFNQIIKDLIYKLDNYKNLQIDDVVYNLENADSKIISLIEIAKETNDIKKETILSDIHDIIIKINSNIIRLQKINDNIKTDLITISIFPTIIEKEIKNTNSIEIIKVDRTIQNSKNIINEINSNNKINIYEIKQFAKIINYLNISNKDSCLKSIRELNNININENNINLIQNYIVQCQTYLNSIFNEKMSEDQIEKHFYLINKINTNYYIYLQNNELFSSYLKSLKNNREVLLILKSNFDKYKFKEKSMFEKISEWIGASKKQISNFNEEEYIINNILNSINNIEKDIISNKKFKTELNKKQFEYKIFDLISKQIRFINKLTNIKINEYSKGKNLFYFDLNSYSTNAIEEIVKIENYRIDHYDENEKKWLTYNPENKEHSDFDQFTNNNYYVITIN